MNSTEFYQWKITELPSLKNEISAIVNKMNRYYNLPWPFSEIAEAKREKLKKKLCNLQNVHFDFGFKCAFGNLYGKSVWFTNTYILDYAPIYFGEHITIGPDVKLITSWHEPLNFNIVKAKPIHIEDNVWITMNVIILPGVTIGKNSIIGAGSVVTKSIPPNSLVGGNPAKVIKKINREYPYWNDLNRDILIRNKNTKKSLSKKLINLFIKKPIKKMFYLFS